MNKKVLSIAIQIVRCKKAIAEYLKHTAVSDDKKTTFSIIDNPVDKKDEPNRNRRILPRFYILPLAGYSNLNNPVSPIERGSQIIPDPRFYSVAKKPKKNKNNDK